MKPGIYPNLSNEDYHGHKESISRSGIMDFDESPYLYWAKHLNPNRPPREATKAMDFGTALHTFVLEPTLFENQYCLEPPYEETPKRVLLKNVGRPAYEAYKAEKAKIDFINNKRKEEHEDAVLEKGKLVLSLNDYHLLQNMKQALMNHAEAWELIQGGIYEQSYFWKDKESGLLVKARPDILHNNMYVDLKSCDSASTRAYQKAMVTHGYHIQGSMVQDGVRELEGRDLHAVINICIEKKYPHQIGIKIISYEALEIGRKKYKKVLLDLSRAIEYNTFPSYQPETIDLPNWTKE